PGARVSPQARERPMNRADSVRLVILPPRPCATPLPPSIAGYRRPSWRRGSSAAAPRVAEGVPYPYNPQPSDIPAGTLTATETHDGQATGGADGSGGIRGATHVRRAGRPLGPGAHRREPDHARRALRAGAGGRGPDRARPRSVSPTLPRGRRGHPLRL